MTRSSNESELISRAKSADTHALATIYERYEQAIYRYIYYRVGDRELAEDLRAEVFLRMLEGIEQYETGAGQLQPGSTALPMIALSTPYADATNARNCLLKPGRIFAMALKAYLIPNSIMKNCTRA